MNGKPQSTRLVREMRPTLIVGLGGTGQEVLVRIKARFLDTFGPDALDVIKLAALDTVVEGFQVPRANGSLAKLDRTELLDIGNVPTVQVLQNLDYSFPQIKQWLPRDLPGQSIVAGAKQIRPMGRLAFFYHFRRIRDFFDKLIKEMANINQQFRVGDVKAEDFEGTHIYIVSSICGGTGSGVFLDTAYLLRSLCRSLNQPNVHLTGMLVLPEAFAHVPSEQIKANAYAALLELDHFSSGSLGNNFQVEYPGNSVISDPLRPFNICYLVDGVNERGRSLSGMAQLAPLMAESIFLQISSRIGRQAASAFDNIRVIDESFIDNEGINHPTSYSGFGMSSLVFPADSIKEVCGRRFAASLINQGIFRQAAQPSIVKGEIDKFLEVSQVRQDLILAAVTRDEQGRPLTLRLEQSGLTLAALEQLSKQDLLTQLQTRAQAFETKILGDSLRKMLDLNVAKLQASLQEQVQAEVARLLNDPSRGVLVVGPFLEGVRSAVSETISHLDGQRRDKQETLARNTSSLPSALQRLQQALEALVDIAGRRRKEALTAAHTAYRNLFNLQFDIMRLDYAIRLLSMLVTQFDAQRRETDILIDQLRAAAKQFQSTDESLSQRWDSQQNAREQIITDAVDLNTLYANHVRDVGQLLTQLTESDVAGPVSTWRTKYPTYEDISKMIFQFAQNVFDPIADMRLEDEIMRKRDAMPPDVRLEQLRSTSVPFWSIQMARVPDGGTNLESVQVVAVENKDATIFQEEVNLRGTVATTTLDKHRITVLQTRHGIPISALAQIDDYRRLYEQYSKRRSVPLHIFPIRDPRRARTMFALGEAFGAITKDGAANYSLLSNDPHKAPTALAQGIEEAIRRFSLSAEYVSRVEQLVEAQVRSKGEVEAGKLVDMYLERPLSSTIRRQEIERELKVLAREYRQNYL